MKIAVASGKGGTGKTLVATNFAYFVSKENPVTLYDLDVEEPNAALFFNAEKKEVKSVQVMIPVVDEKKCDHCGVCSRICEYHAIINLGNQVMVFPELCHSCYGCLELCPQGAISEGKKEIGTIHTAKHNNIEIVTGVLKISESATPKLIRETKKELSDKNSIEIYDSPPGTSCPVIEVVKDVDYVLIVGEPTPFGLHDLDLLMQVIEQLKIPFGVLINKADEQNNLIKQYCIEKNVEIIGEIPMRHDIACTYAKGKLIIDEIDDMSSLFESIWDKIMQKVNEAAL